MPLTAVNFVNKGPVLHNDLLQFFNLFTGVMVDQPVTFKNTVSVGGGQGNTTVPLKLYGATGQTSHLLDLYVDSTQAQPGWGIAATGVMQWGPGGVAPVDTTLSRVGTQNGHATDTAGLLIQHMWSVRAAGFPVPYADPWNDAYQARLIKLQAQQALREPAITPEWVLDFTLLEFLPGTTALVPTTIFVYDMDWTANIPANPDLQALYGYDMPMAVYDAQLP